MMMVFIAVSESPLDFRLCLVAVVMMPSRRNFESLILSHESARKREVSYSTCVPIDGVDDHGQPATLQPNERQLLCVVLYYSLERRLPT